MEHHAVAIAKYDIYEFDSGIAVSKEELDANTTLSQEEKDARCFLAHPKGHTFYAYNKDGQSCWCGNGEDGCFWRHGGGFDKFLEVIEGGGKMSNVTLERKTR